MKLVSPIAPWQSPKVITPWDARRWRLCFGRNHVTPTVLFASVPNCSLVVFFRWSVRKHSPRRRCCHKLQEVGPWPGAPWVGGPRTVLIIVNAQILSRLTPSDIATPLSFPVPSHRVCASVRTSVRRHLQNQTKIFFSQIFRSHLISPAISLPAWVQFWLKACEKVVRC